MTCRIVTVEDDYDLAWLLTERLTDRGCRVLAAWSALDEAFRSGLWPHVDVAVVDLRLPAADGTVLLAWLADHHPHVRRVLITAATDSELAHVDLSSVEHLLHKPFSTVRLLDAVEVAGHTHAA